MTRNDAVPVNFSQIPPMNNLSNSIRMMLVVVLFTGSLLAQTDYRLSLFTEGGAPAGGNVTILVNSAYAVGYSEDLKVPLWAVYRLGNKRADTIPKWERPPRFEVDYRTTARISHEDYVRNYDGVTWDRGHMVPNAAMEHQYGQLAQLETYLMSNIIPQTSQLNQGLWQDLEEEIREKISQDDTSGKEVHDVWVICGPVFATQPVARWPAGIAVPTHCFMIVAYRQGYSGTVKAAGFLFPQKPAAGSTIQDHAVSIRTIETQTGLNFFPELTVQRQNNLETVKRDLSLNEIP